eukprot:evm.model.scf_2388.1 EVM.evm.TU.scf_2388.1   scf_2388:10559-15702(+)
MAGADDPSLTETPEYRIVILFIGFILLTYAYEKGTHSLTHHLKKKNRHGLLHTIHKLQEEILALGLISLILIAIEEFLIQICIDSSGSSSKKGKDKSATSSKKGTESKEKSKEKAAAPEPAVEGTDADVMDSVLSAELNGTETDATVVPSPEESPEDEVPAEPILDDEDLPTDAVLSPDDLGNRKLLGMAMRTLLAGGGGEEVCPSGKESFWSIRTIHETHIFIFVLAVTHILFAGLSMLVCSWKVRQWKQWEDNCQQGLKRVECGNLLNHENIFIVYFQAFFAQFHQHIDEPMYLGLRRLFIERMELDSSFHFHDFLVNSMEEEFSKVVKIDWVMWAVAAIWIGTNIYVVYIMTGLGVVLTLLTGTKLEYIALKLGNEAYIYYSDKPPPSAHRHKGNVITRNLKRLSMSLQGKGGQNVEMTKQANGGGFFDSADSNSKAQPVTEGWDRSGRESHDSAGGHDSAVSMTRDGSPDVSVAEMSISDYEHLPRGARIANGDPVSWASSDGRIGADAYDRLVADRNRAAAVASTRGAAEPVGCFAWLSSCFCCNDAAYNHQLKKMRANTFSASYIPQDSAHLFPFKRPRLMLRVFQYTYFETSLHMAILLFNLWQVDPGQEQFIIPSGWDVHWLVFIGIFVMLITSILILPVYWLTMVTGSHCPSKVLKKARKKKVRPQAVRALEKVSMSLARTSVGLARTSVGANRQSTGLNRPSMGVNGASNGLNRPSMGVNAPSMGLNRPSAGLQRVSIGAASTSTDGPPDNLFPQHWADLEQVAKEVKEVDEEESNAAHGTGALGMLVAGMLKTKRKELDKISDFGQERTPSPPPQEPGPPPLTRKSKPLLGRLSIPLVSLPGKKEAPAPQPEPVDPVEKTSEAATDAGTGSASLGLSVARGPMAGLHDIQEVATPMEGGTPMRKSKSDAKLSEQDAQLEPDSPKSTDSGRPSLSRSSMPMVKMLDRKQKAYLARERQVGDRMMREGPEEEERETLGELPAPGQGYGGKRRPPVHRLDDRSPPSAGSYTAGSERGKAASVHSDSDTTGSIGNPGSSSRPSLDHVAELFKLGEKRKQQRE